MLRSHLVVFAHNLNCDLLTLACTHAQRGLLYIVGLSVCACVRPENQTSLTQISLAVPQNKGMNDFAFFKAQKWVKRQTNYP